MRVPRPLLAVLVVAFTVASGLALRDRSYLGLWRLVGQDSGTVQLFVDLSVAMVLVTTWMLRDARARGVAAWPYVVASVLLGSAGPLAFLVHREVRGGGLASTPAADSGSSASSDQGGEAGSCTSASSDQPVEAGSCTSTSSDKRLEAGSATSASSDQPSKTGSGSSASPDQRLEAGAGSSPSSDERAEPAAARSVGGPARKMLSHASLGVRDLDRSRAFYDAVLGAIGAVRTWDSPAGIGYGPPGAEDQLALFPRPGDGQLAAGPGTHLALVAPERAAVDAFHAAALAHGGQDLGPPGLRPRYGEAYYAAFVLDPDGHKLEAKHDGSGG